MKEQDFAGSNYIIGFYQDVDALTEAFAGYSVVFNETRAKYGEFKTPDDFKKVEGRDKDILKNAIQTLLFSATKAKIKFEALSDKFGKLKGSEDIDKVYREIIHSTIPELALTEKYVAKMNSLFIEGVIADYFMKAQDLLGGSYSGSKTD